MDYWSQYWSEGNLTSFGDKKNENYDGDIEIQWSKFFSLLSAGDKVLDLGSGNGALVELALTKNANSEKCIFYSVDKANLNPNDGLKSRPNINFLSSVEMEELPFSANSFDFVVSNFGIEYGDPKRSFSELSRVLKKHGKFQLLMHDSRSSIVIPNWHIKLAIENILNENGIALLEHHLLSLNEGLKKELDSKKMLVDYLASWKNRDYQSFISTNYPSFASFILRKDVSLEKKNYFFEVFKSGLTAQMERLNDLCDAALSEKRMDQYLDVIKSLPIKMDPPLSIVDKWKKPIAFLFKGEKTN